MSCFSELLSQYTFPTFLAPMEDVTSSPFRIICKEFGADFVITEFISSDALIRDAAKSLKKLAFEEKERPFGVQIFGQDENSLSKAAEVAACANPDFIDINWGCPVKKIVSKGAGAAILKDIPKMIKLTKAVVECVNIPVTVKTRLGWDENDKPIVSIAEKLQDIGIQALTIHGRTRSQLYGGKADWTLIGEVKNNPRMYIPIIGNGDIDSGTKALEFKKLYGVDAIMVGRASIGNPWIFSEIKSLFDNRSFIPPSYEERVALCLRHLRLLAEWKNERVAALEMRRHYAGYFKSIPNFKEKKIQLMQAQTIQECESILLN